MARLGTISLLDDAQSRASGAAFALSGPCSADGMQVISDAAVEVRAGQRDVVVRFEEARDPTEAFEKGHRLAQEGLDMLSLLGRCDAVIQDAESEHLIWWSEEGGVVLRQVSTTLLRFGVGSPTLVVRDKDGQIVPPTVREPSYHIGFRYYRLAQTTDDLYDAYRNMYLAFEVLLSSHFPIRKGEKEIAWLRRALADCGDTIRLKAIVPKESTDVLEAALRTIYQDARLPLFHAKDGKSFFAPQNSSADRIVISKALQALTQIVLNIADVWFGARRMGGGVFFGWVYENTRRMLAESTMVATNYPGPFQANEKDLSHERFRTAIKLESRLAPELQRDREPVILATAPAKSLEPLGEIRRLELITSEHPIMAQVLESPLVCDHATRLEVLMHVQAENINQPKSMFKR